MIDKKDRRTVRRWLAEVVFAEKSHLISLVIWSVGLSLINGLLVLLIGPVFKTFFSDLKPGEAVSPGELFPEWNWLFSDGLTLNYSIIALAIPILLSMTGIMRSIVLFKYAITQDRFSLHVTNNYRVKLFDTILLLPYINLSAKSPGQWMSYLVNDVQFLQTRISEILKVAVKETAMIIGIIIGLLIVNAKVTLIVLGLMCPLCFFGFRIGKKIAKYTNLGQKILGEISSVTSHLRKSFLYFRSQNGEKAELRGFSRFNQHYFSAIKKSIFARSILTPGLELIGTLALCMILIYFQSYSKSTQPDYMFQVILSVGLIMRPLRALGDQLAKYGELKGALAHTFEAIIELEKVGKTETIPRSKDIPITYPLKIEKISLQLGEKLVYDFENLCINRSEMIAIVGPSGSGKSSFLKTLAGLYQPTLYEASNTITTIKESSSYVSQNPFFFNGPIKDNITYANHKHHSLDKINNTLNDLSLNDKKLLDKRIETGSKEVSQGQLQRLTTARAILREKKILLFDEASSALDIKTERSIICYLKNYVKENKFSSLWITHRLEVLDDFDRVWLIEDGNLREVEKNSLKQNSMV